jgi:diphthine-ammonia ligase
MLPKSLLYVNPSMPQHPLTSGATDLLSQERATILDISHLTLYLSPSSMSLFPLINTVYSSYFGTAPPTRACISIHMPEDGVRIKFEAIAEVGGGERKSLHVQSLSYWAAANIGPYSQGVTVRPFLVSMACS